MHGKIRPSIVSTLCESLSGHFSNGNPFSLLAKNLRNKKYECDKDTDMPSMPLKEKDASNKPAHLHSMIGARVCIIM